MASILDQSPEVIEKVLKLTGLTIEELTAEIELTANIETQGLAIVGANPALEKKFTMPIGAIFPGDDDINE
jgi:hypothetical protein